MSFPQIQQHLMGFSGENMAGDLPFDSDVEVKLLTTPSHFDFASSSVRFVNSGIPPVVRQIFVTNVAAKIQNQVEVRSM